MSAPTTRSVVYMLFAVLIAFVMGIKFGTPAASHSPWRVARELHDLHVVAEENAATKSALEKIRTDLASAREDNIRLRAEESHFTRFDRMGAAPARHEIQLGVQKNLRFIQILRDKYIRDHGRAPASLDQIVGPLSNLKRLISVDGEDYASVSLEAAGTLTVTTAGGITVWHRDGNPDGASKVDYPPKEVRYHEMSAAQHKAIWAASVAYRAANGGENVRHDAELLPFFATPQQGADFLELIEEQAAAGLR